MPSDAWPIKTEFKSLESLRKIYDQKLDDILGEQLTVENIETFADVALSDFISITEKILEESKKNPNFKFNSSLDKKTQEDEAYKTLELPDVQETLQSIIEVKDEIDSLKTNIQENTERTKKVITPTQANIETKIKKGDGSFREKKTFSRLLTLYYILKHDFDLTPTSKSASILEGNIAPEMMRKLPYERVEIPELSRVAYICDEEGNASYLFDTEELKARNITLNELDLYEKDKKEDLINSYPGVGVRLIQTKNWRENVVDLLLKEIPEKHKEEIEDKQIKRESEFKINKKESLLTFENFQKEVMSLYRGHVGVQRWFREEQKNHTNWPTNPLRTYKDKGWEGLSKLVGLEKKEFLPFDKFQNEVNNLYEGQRDIEKWYSEEQKNHINWPSTPNRVYEDKGWKSWRELMGLEKKEFLSFGDFQEEVKKIYPKRGDVNRWYGEETKKHPNWPAAPDITYKNKGWVGWPELVDKENFLKKVFLSFENFQEEVRGLCPVKTGIEEWYRKEQKKHINWPSSPRTVYKNKDWKGWLELVDKKKES